MMTSKLSKKISGNMKNLGQNVLRGTDVSDCEQLYCLLGLLILEGRIPENSESGRSPGPHAHFSFNNTAFKNHSCDLTSRCCQIAEQYRERLCDLARRGQPINIQVWLLPECGHYDFSINSNNSNSGSSRHDDPESMLQENLIVQMDCPVQEGFLLIEDWSITVSPRRNFGGPIQTVTCLLKTMSSYLHSSRLGTSLCESRGSFPSNIYYRISSASNNNSASASSDSSLMGSRPFDSGNGADYYRHSEFPAINSGESNVLSVSLSSLVSPSAYLSPVTCHICTTTNPNTNKSPSSFPHKIPCSNSATSLTTDTTNTSLPHSDKRAKTGSVESQHHDKRRGFTLPLHHHHHHSQYHQQQQQLPSSRHRFRKQQIISPMVVCTDQSEQTPPLATITKNRYYGGGIRPSNHQHQHQPSVIKDLTPYQPKFETFQDVSNSFLDNGNRKSTEFYTNATKHNLNSNSLHQNIGTITTNCHNNQYFKPYNDDDLNKLEELSDNFLKNTMVTRCGNNRNNNNGCGGGGGDSSSNSHTPVMQVRPTAPPPFRRKSENRIIFTDSSSCESIDKYSSNPCQVLTKTTTTNTASATNSGISHNYDDVAATQDCHMTSVPNKLHNNNSNNGIENNKVVAPESVVFSLGPAIQPQKRNPALLHKEPMGDPDVCAIFQKENPYRKHDANPAMMFHKTTGLPLQSSPAPAKRGSSYKQQGTQMNGCANRASSTSESITIKHNRSAMAMPYHHHHHHHHHHHNQNRGMARLAVTPGVECYGGTGSKSSSSYSNTTTTNSTTTNTNSSICSGSSTDTGTSNNDSNIDTNTTNSSNHHHNHHHHHHHDLCCLPPNRSLSSSAPVVSSQKLLVNFEESMLNLRIHPVGVIDGFEVEIGASGSFNPKHVRLPLLTYFFQLSDDNAPSPYLGFLDLASLTNRRGYQIPKKGSIQLTLFNPNGAVIKMFVVLYNLSDMPGNHQTFLRQRTVYLPVSMANTLCPRQQCPHANSSLLTNNNTSNTTDSNDGFQLHYNTASSLQDLPSYLRYLVHLKIHSSKSGKLYLHTDIRLIFSRDKFEFDPSVATYELRSFVDPTPEPRYSPKN